jgi:NhaA family Na+:H+ antiporter
MTTTSSIARFVRDRFLLVPLGAIAALVWANTAGESYFRFAHASSFLVNDVGMTLFLGLMAQRVFEAVMPGGALNHWRHWGAATMAAAGGVVGSALSYRSFVNWRAETVLDRAWPVAIAVDIVAGYYLLQLIFGSRRAPSLSFFLLMAALMDAAGLAIIAPVPAPVDLFIGAGLVAAAIGLVLMFRYAVRITFLAPYVFFAGPLAWMGFRQLGLYPALALVPLVPWLPHAARSHGLLAEPRAGGDVGRSERDWNATVQLILFAFGLVNAGVELHDIDTGAHAMALATLIGRPAGITAGMAIAWLSGLRFPSGMSWRDLIVVAFAASAGFTFTFLFATTALPIGAVLTQIKVGTLSAVAGIFVALAMAWVLQVGRFSRPSEG